MSNFIINPLEKSNQKVNQNIPQEDIGLEIRSSPEENDNQPIILVCLKELSEKKRDKLAKVKDLRIFEVNRLSKNLDFSQLKDKFDLIIMDAFGDTEFQMLRENYLDWKEQFNLVLYQRDGFSSDQSFSKYFECICKQLPLDARDVVEFKKGIVNRPYLQRPQSPFLVILKKLLRIIFK